MALNENQLLQLKNFVQSRGIIAQDIVREILDHFACKVEEFLEQEPNMPFERALQLAHESFGKMGLRPIAQHYEQQVEKTMWRIFKKEVKSVMLSPQMLLLIIIGILIFPLVKTIGKETYKNWLFSFDLLGLLLIIFISSIYYYLTFKKIKAAIKVNWWGKHSKENYWQQMVFSIPRIPLLPILIGGLVGSDFSKINYQACSIIIIVFLILSIIRVKAQYQTYVVMENRFRQRILD